MKLVGKLKKQVEATNSKEEARNTIAKAGMMLTDDELETVSGGYGEENTEGENDDEYYIPVDVILRRRS